MEVCLGLLIPFLGTALGSSICFFMKKNINKKIEKILFGFAAGVMIAASVWSLIIPAIDMSKLQNIISWVPATIGFMLGIIFLILFENLTSYLEKSNKTKLVLNKTTIMILAITLHNIPEGMAVGVAFAGAIAQNSGINMAGAIALAVGIAIQNFPEGSIISMPLKANGMAKLKAFIYGMLSGIVEPIAAIIALALTNLVIPILPYFLSFAAGAMMYVVVKELIPESQNNEHSNLGVLGVSLGFIIMMILDVAFG